VHDASRIEEGGEPPTPVGAIEADRYCLRCGANLRGQGVVREPHYDLHLARCPACDAVAPQHVHSRLQRWKDRWTAFGIALWLCLLSLILLGGTATMLGLSVGTAALVSNDWGTWIQLRYEQSLPERATGVRRVRDNQAFEKWWAAQDPDVLFAEAGGWREALNWSGLHLWWLLGLGAAALGALAAVLMPALRWRGRIAWIAIVALLLGGVSAATLRLWVIVAQDDPWLIAAARVGPVLVPASVLVALAGTLAGLVFGHGIARAVAGYLLPTRLRSSLAVLWTVDGLAAPPAGRPRRA
jgi:hypothetical protein